MKPTSPVRACGVVAMSCVAALSFHMPADRAEAGLDSQGEPPVIVVQRLSPRAIALHFEGPQISNVVAVRSTKGIVVIDAESSPSLGRLLRDRILEEFPGERIRWLINTHGHGDHTWGNQAFGDVDIIGQENILVDMAAVEGNAPGDAERMASYVDRLEARRGDAVPNSPDARELERTIRYFFTAKEGLEAGFRSTPPNLLFSGRLELRAGDLTFRLLSFPRAHSNGDILVFCPEEGLLATGDLFLPRMRPPYLKTETLGGLPAWIAVLDSVLTNAAAVRHIIPGHDAFLAMEDLREVRAYLGSERERVAGKRPAWPLFQRTREEEGSAAALARLETLADEPDIFLMEADLVGLGYTFLSREHAPAEAVRVFQAMTRLCPDSWNAWDCLGEASTEAGDLELARTSYSRSLELNPQNAHATRALREVREEPER